jgi:hypothetical protein
MLKCKCFRCNYETSAETEEKLQTNINYDGGLYLPEQEYSECPKCHYDSLEIV